MNIVSHPTWDQRLHSTRPLLDKIGRVFLDCPEGQDTALWFAQAWAELVAQWLDWRSGSGDYGGKPHARLSTGLHELYSNMEQVGRPMSRLSGLYQTGLELVFPASLTRKELFDQACGFLFHSFDSVTWFTRVCLVPGDLALASTSDWTERVSCYFWAVQEALALTDVGRELQAPDLAPAPRRTLQIRIAITIGNFVLAVHWARKRPLMSEVRTQLLAVLVTTLSASLLWAKDKTKRSKELWEKAKDAKPATDANAAKGAKGVDAWAKTVKDAARAKRAKALSSARGGDAGDGELQHQHQQEEPARVETGEMLQ